MDFPILFTEFTAIQNAFNLLPGNQIKKIVFQFQFNQQGSNNQPNLTGYVAKQNGEFTTQQPVITLQKSTSTTPVVLGNPLNLGSIEFTRLAYEDLLQNPQTYLVFIPLKSTCFPSLNAVTYKTAWSQSVLFTDVITTLAIGDELNPSPPKPPVL